ncbi:hypothetical protein [Kribbella sp. CA-294648]|uniref:hypothetical protein n=1 Tax=Kribbella sp. CA-294648 TaxID=3239948 RepID=UPI003D8F4FB2
MPHLPAVDAPSRLSSYRSRHPRAAKALGRTLNIPELVGNAPIPSDIGTRLALARIDVGQATIH